MTLFANFPSFIIAVHNLHTQWIENLWQIMKSICTQKIGLIGFKMVDWRHLSLWKMTLFANFPSFIVVVHNLHTQWIENLWHIVKSIGTHKIGLIGFNMADWRPSLFVKNDTICQFSRFHRSCSWFTYTMNWKLVANHSSGGCTCYPISMKLHTYIAYAAK